jgi:hypothetical protein
MDPRTVEINNLRILNDYLNQTIEAMVRAQRVGLTPFAAGGLSHTPFAGAFNQTPFTGTAGFGVDPVFSQYVPFAGATGIAPQYAAMIDPFLAQRGLSHSAHATMGTTWNPIAELVRQQQLQQLQLQQQQFGLGGYRTPWGVPV